MHSDGHKPHNVRPVQITKGGGGARLATGHHEAAPFGAAEFPSPIFSYLPSLLRTTWELALRPVLSLSIVREGICQHLAFEKKPYNKL